MVVALSVVMAPLQGGCNAQRKAREHPRTRAESLRARLARPPTPKRQLFGIEKCLNVPRYSNDLKRHDPTGFSSSRFSTHSKKS